MPYTIVKFDVSMAHLLPHPQEEFAVIGKLVPRWSVIRANGSIFGPTTASQWDYADSAYFPAFWRYAILPSSGTPRRAGSA
jgi:hypothetical protein